MDRLPAERRQDIVKTSTDRLRTRLINAGYDEDTVIAYDRYALMEAYAEYLLTPPPAEPLRGAVGRVDVPGDEEATGEEDVPVERKVEVTAAEEQVVELTELQLRQLELRERVRERELSEMEVKERAAETERQREKEKSDQKLRERELDIREMEWKLWQQELQN